MFGVLGPNGAGKTTLIKILSTLILPSDGEAYVNGYNILREEKEVKASIGLVSCDERSFYWRLTGRQNLRFFALLNNLNYSAAEKRINSLLSLLEIEPIADRSFKDLSSGMRQRLAIARGLLTDPEIIFLDEPTRNLDFHSARKIKEFIKREIAFRRGKTILYATNNLLEAEEMCNRIIILHKGSLKLCGELREMKRVESYNLFIKDCSHEFINKFRKLNLLKVVGQPQFNSEKGEYNFKIETQSISEVIRWVIEKGGEVTGCVPVERKLDEIFSKVTGRDEDYLFQE
ncbi:MAG: ABC transporter ATP-binding protein [Fidelibacterota bacterium]